MDAGHPGADARARGRGAGHEGTTRTRRGRWSSTWSWAASASASRGARHGGCSWWAARDLTERLAWFWATLAFGLLHLPNAVFGAGPAAISQGGPGLHTPAPRCTCCGAGRGALPAMLLHGFWDFSAFIGDGGTVAGMLQHGRGHRYSVVPAVVLTRRDRDAATLAPYAVAHPVATNRPLGRTTDAVVGSARTRRGTGSGAAVGAGCRARPVDRRRVTHLDPALRRRGSARGQL